MPGAGFGDFPEFATANVTVAGDDITGLQLTSTKPSTVTGRVVFADTQAASSLRPASLGFAAMAKNPEDFGPMNMGGPGRVHDDFTFEIKSRPGVVVIRTMMPTPGWSIKAVRVSNADVTDDGFEVRAGEDLSGVEVEMTNRQSDVSGLVTNAKGEAVKDYSLVVFPQDRERWGPGSRYLRTGRPDQDGRFKITGLPPGQYYAIAVDYIEQGDSNDPEFLDRVQQRATRFSLNDGETKTVDLKITPAS
jgi:hypothetical protein